MTLFKEPIFELNLFGIFNTQTPESKMEIEKKLRESGSQYEYSHLKKYFAEEAFNRPKVNSFLS
mgnify:CR=1 FL=1